MFFCLAGEGGGVARVSEFCLLRIRIENCFVFWGFGGRGGAAGVSELILL